MGIGESIEPLFTKKFHDRKLPVWQDVEGWDFGEIDAKGYVPPPAAIPMSVEAGPKPFKAFAMDKNTGNGAFTNFILGLVFGIAVYLLYLNREKVIALVKTGISKIKKGENNA